MSSSSSRKGGHRRGKNNAPFHHHQNNYQTDEYNSNQNQDNDAPSSELHQKDQKRPQNRRNSRWVSRNSGFKPQSVKKYEIKEDSNGGPGSKSEPDSNCDDGREKEEDPATGSGSKLKLDSKDDNPSAGGSGSKLIHDSNNGKIEMCRDDKGKGVEKAEGSNSSGEIDDEDDDPVKRLDELRLRVEEVKLSEELLSINNQLQEDELLVMESIYGENIVILENQSGLQCFQVHIHIEVPKELLVSTKLYSSQDFSYSFEVEYLPPIILTCLLPKSYPSNHAPFFTISIQWLNSAKISDLCCKLDSIWQEQTGQEVIYQWVEWLQECTLSHLSFGHEIILGPYGARPNVDRRAISGSVSPNIDIPLIKSNNDEQRHENFCRNIQECCICFSEFPGSEFIRLPCQHFFCWKCLKTFADIHITEGTIMKLQCPQSKCEGMIPPGLLKRLLGDEEFERWESLTLEKTLASMSDVAYCPRCETACLEDEANHAQCSKCYYSFCTLCREKRHVGVTCMTPEMKLLILQERQNSTLIKEEQRRREQDMINQLLSVREINNFAKQCPSCKMAISRTEGCNKMVCNNCGQYFCYRCNQAISGYEHFRDENCELFPKEEIQRWEEAMNHRQIVGQIQAQMFAGHGHPCPNCRQDNVKVGNNNHIFCWACQNHYCYLCRKTVRRSSQHYGPKGCKQHTVG
ncbi:hypothetical protein ACJIZ3_003824 [Penstemon smallii]|uniref:RBR-type E3 ubiquitin transferase n=1 Tax=Penstemon smallii TaxID=265156 RepID=A0ABD3S0A9_9LAMI